jgi:tripartite-type tricarboxylate transporter receptor subunit TctC
MHSWNRRDFLKGAGLVVGATALPLAGARGAAWPSKPITAVIGYKAGGGTDFVARTVTSIMEPMLDGSTIKAVNQPGAAASVATDFVWNKPADGYWWLATSGFNRGLRVTKRHDTSPYLDWQFYHADTAIMSVSVKPDSPIRDMADFIKRCNDNPGSLKVSNSGIGGSWHLGGTLMKKYAKIDYTDVPYKGGKPAVLACLNGEVDAVTSGFHEHLQHLKSGQLRNLAVCSSEDITIQGVSVTSITHTVPGLTAHTPFGGGSTMGLRRNTDPAVLKQIGDAWMQAIGSDKFKELEAKKPRFPDPAIGAEADRRAALWETVAANLLHEAGKSKADPKDLGIPTIEDFDNFWPPKGYKPAF